MGEIKNSISDILTKNIPEKVNSSITSYAKEYGQLLSFREKKVTWQEFITEFTNIPNFSDNDGTMLYRGHSDPKWEIMSAAERIFKKDPKRKYARTEFNLWVNNIFNEFRSKAIATEQWQNTVIGKESDRIALFCMGRHYGLINPIVDWTTSPFVAAFFAVSDFVDKHYMNNIIEKNAISEPENRFVVVFATGPIYPDQFQNQGMNSKVLSQSVGDKGKLWFYDNQEIFIRRQFAQSSRFSILESDLFDTGVFILRNTKMNLFAYCIEISNKKEALYILNDLKSMNIHFGTIFPDIEGAQRYANYIAHLKIDDFSDKAVDLVNTRDYLKTELISLEQNLKNHPTDSKSKAIVKLVQDFQQKEGYGNCFCNDNKSHICENNDCRWRHFCFNYSLYGLGIELKNKLKTIIDEKKQIDSNLKMRIQDFQKKEGYEDCFMNSKYLCRDLHNLCSWRIGCTIPKISQEIKQTDFNLKGPVISEVFS